MRTALGGTLALGAGAPFGNQNPYVCSQYGSLQKVWGRYGIKYIIGSGPFKYESWKPGDSLTVVKNTEYTWGPGIAKNKGPAVIDKFVYREIKDESTRFLELKTGNLDVLFSVPTMFLKKVEEDPKIDVVRLPGVLLFHMVMNTKSEPLNDLMVRKGIALAVNQDSITKNVFASAGQPAHNYLIVLSQYVWAPIYLPDQIFAVN